MKKKELKRLLRETQDKLNMASTIVGRQMTFIDTLENQLKVQDKAIERKDLQYQGLKAAYKDDLINGQI